MKNIFKNKKLIRIASFSLVAIVCILCSVGFISQQADINRLKAQKAEYSQKLTEQNKDNDRLQSILDSEDKDGYIEQKAREKGYAKSDEIVFYDISSTN